MKRKLLLLVTALLMTAMGVKADDAFVVWDAANTTLYFSYGEVPTENGSWTPAGGSAITVSKVWSGTKVTASGSSDPIWNSSAQTACTKAVFEPSFKNVKPTSCNSWFSNYNSLTSIVGFTNLDTSEVTDMSYMLQGNKCPSLDLSSFNTVKVTNMDQMFYNNNTLTAIIVGDSWNTAAVTSSDYMFTNCNNLVGEDGTTVGSTTDVTYAHTGAGGYLTKKTVTVAANTVGSDNWASYYKSNVNRKADANTVVYQAAVSGSTMTLTEVSDKVIKAGQAVVLKSTAATITLTSTTDAAADDFSGNVLEGVDADTAPTSGNTYYVLGTGSVGIGFYQFTGTLGANKAYYSVPAGAREYYAINGFSTGIENLHVVNFDGTEQWYDLSGRRLAQPKKGVNIVNGKKVIMK